MRTFTLLAAIAPVVLAQTYNPHLCGGVGGCPRNGGPGLPNRPLRCPDGTRANLLQKNSIENSFWEGNYRVITNEEFPATCIGNVRPGADDITFVSEVVPGKYGYGFVNGTCSDRTDITRPVTALDCYAGDPNPHLFYLCDVQDVKGGSCEPFMEAGFCESFGPRSDGRCATWTPDQVEEACWNEALGQRCG